MSKVMIFKGRKPVRKVLFFLGLQELETVESMKYLGVDFAANWSWLNTKVRLAKKARARLACVTKAIYEGLTLDSGENLWRTLVRPILEYGCEIWEAARRRTVVGCGTHSVGCGEKLLSAVRLPQKRFVESWLVVDARPP